MRVVSSYQITTYGDGPSRVSRRSMIKPLHLNVSVFIDREAGFGVARRDNQKGSDAVKHSCWI